MDSDSDWSDLDDSGVQVTEVAIGMPEKSVVQRPACPQNAQKGVKCISCNQYFKTREHMSQHWQAKHNKDDRQIITQCNAEEVRLLESRIEESKRQKLAEDQELLQRHQNEISKLYENVEQKAKADLELRDIANAEKQDREKRREEQLRSDYGKAAHELQLRQTRQITISSLECEIQEEFRDIMRLLQSVPLEEGQFNSPEFAELENLREVVEQEQKAIRDRLSKIDSRNRQFFEKAASKIDSDAGARKLLTMMRDLQPDIACTGSGLQKIQDEISRSLSSLKQMEEAAGTTHKHQSISDLSNSVMEQLTMFLGESVYEYEDISKANTKLSDSSEKLRMATSHVFSSMRDALERLSIPNDAREAFIWMEFADILIDVDDAHDAKLAFPIASEATPVCPFCSDHSTLHSQAGKLYACAHTHRSKQGIVWSCANHFHVSCRDGAQKQLSKHKQRSIEGVRIDKKTMFYCLDCLTHASKKKQMFRAAKLQQAAGVKVPPSLSFCEIYGHISDSNLEEIVSCIKPGVFPFLTFGWHHVERGSADWRSIQYWTIQTKNPSSAQSACKLLVQDCPHGKMWSFSGEIQTQRCARVGVLTSDSIRKCGMKEAWLAELVAAEIMKKMRLSQLHCPPHPQKRWQVICVKKFECWTFALARDNGDVVVVTDGKVSLSGSLPDTSIVPPLRTRTLTVRRCDSQPCAAERVAWNCDGTVLAASCSDHRIVTWEKGRDIDAHPVDKVPERNVKSGTCEWYADGPIVSLNWSPVNPCVILAATASFCFVLHFQTATATCLASISVDAAHDASSVISCATFGSNGSYIAVGTQSSGWFVVNSSKNLQSFRSDYILPHGDSAFSSILSICALPVVKSGSTHRDVVVDGRDFAVASRIASHSIVHIWKYSEFKCKFEVVKELRLPSSSDSSSIVTSLLCSRDSEKDADSFKILALNGSNIGYLINYLGGYCYDTYIRPVDFWCPMEQKPVNVSRAAWGAMARTIAFCDFSATKNRELGGFWWGLPRLYELWRGHTDAHKSVSKPWRADTREAFGPALTCDISVHTFVRDRDSVEDVEQGELRMIETVWNHDVAIHQQVVNDLADYWKEFAKSRSISGEVVEKVVQQIARVVRDRLLLRLSFLPDAEVLPDPVAGKRHGKRQQPCKHGLPSDGSCLVPVNDQGDPYSDLSAELFRSLLKCYLAV